MKTQVASKFRRGLKWLGVFLLLWQGVAGRAGSVTEFPFKLRAGLIWIQVNGAHGGRPLSFILDSGAEASVIDLQAAGRLHLDLGQPITVRGITATAPGYWPERWEARVGGVSLPTNYLVTDLSALSAACQHGVDGLIGADFFVGRAVQIDFAKGKIRLLENYQPGASAQVLPLRIDGSRLRAPVEVVDLGSAWARLDTGCASALHWAISTNTPVGEETTEEVGVGISSVRNRQNDKSVRLGGLTIKDVPTGLHTEPLLAGEAGMLGTGLLSRFSVVTIDEPAKRLILDGLSVPLVSPRWK